MFFDYLFGGYASIDGVSIGKVVGQSYHEGFPLVLVNRADKLGIVHECFQIVHHLVAGFRSAIFVVVPKSTLVTSNFLLSK